MYNSRIRVLRACIAATDLDKTAPAILSTVTLELKDWQTELSGLLADRRERIAMRIHASLVSSPTWMESRFKSNDARIDAREKLAILSVDHANSLCDALDKVNS